MKRITFFENIFPRARGWARAALALGVLTALTPAPLAADPARPKPAPATVEEPSPEDEEAAALDKAINSSRGNPQVLIKNLEDFLERFPETSQRERVLRTIFQQAQQSNEPRKAARAAERLLESKPADIELLSTLIELHEREATPDGRAKALAYAARFIERAEQTARHGSPPEVSAERWQETQSMLRASAYYVRGRILVHSGEDARALPDYEKSFSVYPTAQGAERLGDLVARLGQTERAINLYATAFAFPDKGLDPGFRDQVRKKLGSAYVAKHSSEQGLGDLLLARYDELVASLKDRVEGQGSPNAGVRDPSAYVLERLDGSEVRLAEFRGKIMVMDFWATWCTPCILEGQLFERVRETFRDEPSVAFLAVNVDEDRDRVPGFLEREKWTVPVVFGQGLDQALGVRALPTVMILDGEGRVILRQVGLDTRTFVETLERKIREALGRGVSAGAPGD